MIYEGGDRFQLFDGTTTTVIAEPIQWSDIQIALLRDKDKDSFIFEFVEGDVLLRFDYANRVDLIRTFYQTYGADGVLILQYGKWDGVTFTSLYEGKFNLFTYRNFPDYIECNVESTNLREKVASRMDTKLNLKSTETLDGDSVDALVPAEILMHSKEIFKQLEMNTSIDRNAPTFGLGSYSYPLFSPTFEFDTYCQLGLDYYVKNELSDSFVYPAQFSDNRADVYPIYIALEQGSHTIDIDVTFTPLIRHAARGVVPTDSTTGYTLEFVTCTAEDSIYEYWKWELILVYGTTEVVVDSGIQTTCAATSYAPTSQNVTATYTDVYLMETEKVYMYVRLSVGGEWGTYTNVSVVQDINLWDLTIEQGSYINIQAGTVAPATVATCTYIYEALQRYLYLVTGNPFILKSNLLGRTDTGYFSSGCVSKYSIQNGYEIRGFTDRGVESSLSDFFKSLNAMFSIGIGFEFSDGIYYFTGTIADAGIFLQTTFVIPNGIGSEVEFYDGVTLLGNGTIDSFDGTEYGITPDGSITEFAGTIKVIVTDDIGRDKIVWEQKSNWYRDVESFDLGLVYDYSEETAKDLIFNEVEIGYEKFPDEDLNTLDEFCTKREYLTPIKNEKNKLSLVSPYIASGYAIEYERRQQFKTNNTDSYKYDDDVFMIALAEEPYVYHVLSIGGVVQVIIDQSFIANVINIGDMVTIDGSTVGNDGTYEVLNILSVGSGGTLTQLVLDATLTNETPTYPDCTLTVPAQQLNPETNTSFDVYSGIYSPETTYNLRISPLRMLLNWATYLNSGLFFKAGTEFIRNTFTKNNIDLITQFNGDESCLMGDIDRNTWTESANIELNDFYQNEKRFKPTYIYCKQSLSWQQVQELRDKMLNRSLSGNLGYVTLTDGDGAEHEAYILEMRYHPNKTETSFKLIEKA